MTCGVYSITNIVNGKRYYGSSVNMEGRKRQHFHSLRKGVHRNPHLQAAWNLYGEKSFAFAIVEEVAKENLLATEQRYLDQNHDGYNISKCAESPALGIKWSEDAKERMRNSKRGIRLSDEHKQKLSIAGKGRKATEAQVSAMRARMLGTSMSEEAKAKISNCLRSQWQDPEFRAERLAAQIAGKHTDEAKASYSAASLKLWSDSGHRAKMSEARKRMWADPEFRTRMTEKRKLQGQQLRERNAARKAQENAL